ncbi:MAG: hypothetical protein ACRD4U_05530 [Candidatus Acidiferrales bacterium]
MSYKEQLQRIANDYLGSAERKTARARDIAGWAIRQGRWQPQPADLIDQCARQIADAMREEYITDPQGRRVRAKHSAIIPDGEGEQFAFWADMRTAPREYMEVAFQQRRQHIVAECRQLKSDVESYNENINQGEPIQMVFDFRHDLEEGEIVRKRPAA